MRHILWISLLLFTLNSYALDYMHRPGIGFTNQMKTNHPTLSFKVQKSRRFAMGILAGIDTDDSSGGYGFGVKAYRILIDEPQLNFYGGFLGGLINQKNLGRESETGFQIDLTLGTEFHFKGLNSLAFSLEFGFSFNKINDFVIETVGEHFVTAGVHFYL